jgi:hypothetical protein
MTNIHVGEHAGVPAPVEQVSACYSQVAQHMPEDKEMDKQFSLRHKEITKDIHHKVHETTFFLRRLFLAASRFWARRRSAYPLINSVKREVCYVTTESIDGLQ